MAETPSGVVAHEAPPTRQPREVRLSPYADREILKAKDDYARSVASGQFDEIQLEELWDKTNEYVTRLMKSSAEEQPSSARDTLEQQFDNQVLERQGALIQQDPETGRFEVLSEPVKDARKMEEMQFQQTLDMHKGRIELMKMMTGMQTGNAESGQKPMYAPDQIRREVDLMIPPPAPLQQQQGGQQQPQSAEDYHSRWEQLPVGGTMTWADGKTYRKKG